MLPDCSWSPYYGKHVYLKMRGNKLWYIYYLWKNILFKKKIGHFWFAVLHGEGGIPRSDSRAAENCEHNLREMHMLCFVSHFYIMLWNLFIWNISDIFWGILFELDTLLAIFTENANVSCAGQLKTLLIWSNERKHKTWWCGLNVVCEFWKHSKWVFPQ